MIFRYAAIAYAALCAGDELPTVEVDTGFWDQLSVIIERAGQGMGALRDVWPMSSQTTYDVSTGGWFGGQAAFSGDTAIARSEVRVRDDGSVGLASMHLDGRCITRAEVLRHYPDLDVTQTPRAHGPEQQSTVWSAFGEWGELMFSVPEGGSRCVRQISIVPRSDQSEEAGA